MSKHYELTVLSAVAMAAIVSLAGCGASQSATLSVSQFEEFSRSVYNQIVEPSPGEDGYFSDRFLVCDQEPDPEDRDFCERVGIQAGFAFYDDEGWLLLSETTDTVEQMWRQHISAITWGQSFPAAYPTSSVSGVTVYTEPTGYQYHIAVYHNVVAIWSAGLLDHYDKDTSVEWFVQAVFKPAVDRALAKR